MIKIAFIKFAGLSTGGTEKFLQIIAANLPKDKFSVDFFYCDPAPSIGPVGVMLPTSPLQEAYVRSSGVNLKKFHVGAMDLTKPDHPWVDTNFWEVFNENNYDIIQTGRSGQKEFPFTKIKKTPIVDSLHFTGGVDNQYNISRVMHLCNWSAQRWIARGGDRSRVVLVSLPILPLERQQTDFRQELGIDSGIFVYGFHQRPDNTIFSEIPLAAYAKVENETTAFMLLGGGDAYKKQAQDLGLKHVYFVSPQPSQDGVKRFLNTLNVYAHGRKDGEVNSQAMAEAMAFGLPIVSHYSSVNNGHVECIGQAGLVVKTVTEYAAELSRLKAENEYYQFRSKAALSRFSEMYELSGQINHFIHIYEDVVNNPFPHPVKRFFSTLNYSQTIRWYMVRLHSFLKYQLGLDLLSFRRKQ